MAVWRIYYADGSTVDGNTTAEWDAAPDHGVEVVVTADPQPNTETRYVGRLLLYGCDYYMWPEDSDRPIGAHLVGTDNDSDSLTSAVAKHLAAFLAVKHGQVIESREFEEIVRRAHDEPGFPEKSAWTTGERLVRKVID